VNYLTRIVLLDKAQTTANLRSTSEWRCSQSRNSNWILLCDCRLPWGTAEILCNL